VQRTLEMLSGRVYITSFAQVVFDSMVSCVPRELTIAQPLALDILQCISVEERLEETKHAELPGQTQAPKRRSPETATKNKNKKDRNECMASKKLKGEGCARITAFFALDARAVR
jgi:hypothetical protein